MALNGCPHLNPHRTRQVDGEQEAKLISMRLGPPSKGYGQWITSGRYRSAGELWLSFPRASVELFASPIAPIHELHLNPQQSTINESVNQSPDHYKGSLALDFAIHNSEDLP